ncbi:MAG: Crp/Fnr family transcriptional regulator [Bacteroidota bacterium]
MFSSNPFITIRQLEKWDLELKLGLIHQSIDKGKCFLKAGQRCDHLYFIQKGFVRVYYHDLEGREITHWFCGQDAAITSPFSFIKQEPNQLFFEALEDTYLVLLSASNIETLIEHSPRLHAAFRKLNAEFAMVLSRRIMTIHTQTAEERYLRLLDEHPLLFQKAKLAHIASYLGITQQSLSRIRKNL